MESLLAGVWWYIAGLLTPFCFRVLRGFFLATRVAIYDASFLIRHGQLKAGTSKLSWFWLVPVEFFCSWGKTLWNFLGGVERVLD